MTDDGRLGGIEDDEPYLTLPILNEEEARWLHTLLAGQRDLMSARMRTRLHDATVAAAKAFPQEMLTLPITLPDDRSRRVWAERERTACQRVKVGFAAHGALWHYRRTDGHVLTFNVSKRPPELVQVFTYDGPDWIEEAVRRMNGR